MAQIEQSDKGKKKKGAQKKMSIHVDFTPMVDMNMLLITFFMLCTTMRKASRKIKETQNKAKESEAITMIVTTERDAEGNIKKDENGKPKNIVYFYAGKPQLVGDAASGAIDDSNLEQAEFLGNEEGAARGIRKILHNRNKQVLEKIDKLKAQWRNKEFSTNKDMNDSIYQAKAKEVRNDSTLTRPVVVIKATPEASWESLIGALDEMQINQISRYQIDNMNHMDTLMIEAFKRKNNR